MRPRGLVWKADFEVLPAETVKNSAPGERGVPVNACIYRGAGFPFQEIFRLTMIYYSCYFLCGDVE